MRDQSKSISGPLSWRESRWTQLVLGIICMASVANLQYGWTLFVQPIHNKFGWTHAEIQVAFTLFVLLETWLVPFEGWIVDRIGPRWVIMLGGVLTAVAWLIDSSASHLWMLYLGGAVAGIAGGSVYGTCIGNALKWFPDKRGLCAGLTAMGFGAGAAVTIAPIRHMIASSGFEATFLTFGLIYGVIVVLCSLFVRAPEAHEVPPVQNSRLPQSVVDVPPSQALRSSIFWVMYLMFFLVAAGGLMSAAQLGPIAHERHLTDVTFVIFGGASALVVALTAHSITNGIGRPINGWISDRIGRANMMGLAFAIEAVAIAMFGFVGYSPIAFVITDALMFFFWGDIFSLFAATVGDCFGRKYATTNYGLMYTAKGVASLLVPLGNVLTHATGSWVAVYAVGCIMNLMAAALGFLVLRPVINARIRGQRMAGLGAGVAAASFASGGSGPVGD